MLIILNLGVFLGQKALGPSSREQRQTRIPLSLNSEAIQLVEAETEKPSLVTKNELDLEVEGEEKIPEDDMASVVEKIEVVVNTPEAVTSTEQYHGEIESQTELVAGGNEAIPNAIDNRELESVTNEIEGKEVDGTLDPTVQESIEDLDVSSLELNETKLSQDTTAMDNQNSCYEWTDLDDDEWGRLKDKLDKLNLVYEVVNEQITEIEGYIVLIGPFSSNEASLEKYRMLKQRKIDSFMVNQGKWAHAISLGIFSSQENARVHHAKIQKKIPNEEIHVESRTREKNVHQVKMEWVETEVRLNSELFMVVFEQNEQKMKKISKKSCKEIEFLFLRH